MISLPEIENLTLIISHRGCSDGACAAYIAQKRFPDAEVLFYSYGASEPPDVIGHDVLICDFSFSREEMLFMEVYANRIYVLDHHQTAEEHLRGLPFCFFDMKRSGAGLVWDALYPERLREPLVDYVEDSDLWAWRLPHSKEMSAVIHSYGFKEEDWDELWGRFTTAFLYPDPLIDEGKAINRANNRQVEQICSSAKEVTICGYKALAANAPTLRSDVGNVLAKKHGIGVAWYVDRSGEVQVSIRSTPNGPDVARLAEELGGGGHQRSAACRLPIEEAAEIFMK